MTIRISFPPGQGTVRVECDGQVVEVPLPGSGGGGGGQVANDPDEPQSSGRTPRTTLPRDPRAPITRPPNEPPIAGIVTTGRSAPGVLDAFGMRRLFATPRGQARYLDVREVYSATPEVLRHQVMGWRGERRPGLPFLIDLHVRPDNMAQELPLRDLWPLLEDPTLDLSAIRLVIDPDEQ